MSGEFLSIANYDQREIEARIHASYPALRAFSTPAFAQVNFPTSVKHESELRRYADIMHETRSREEWLTSKFYSTEEAQAMLRLSAQIEQLTRALFDHPVQPLMCLLPQIDLWRMVDHLAAAVGRRLTVLEIGPGSGHLAAYLLNAGHRVIAVDICQALYLWQNRLFGSYDLDEWAAADVRTFPPGHVQAQVTHVPWWHFARFHEILPLSADVVICDAALGEMDHFGFRYVLHIAKIVVQRSDVGCFMYQNLGEERFQNRASAEQYLATLGFRLRCIGGVSLFVGSDKFPLNAIDGLDQAPPIGGESSMLAPAKFLPLERSKFLESYAFFEFINIGH
jgi:SAM-dependent methyltransferase